MLYFRQPSPFRLLEVYLQLNSKLKIRSLLVLVSAALLSPSLSRPAAIQISGGAGNPVACPVGSCASPDALTVGQAVNLTNFIFDYTFTNGDKFQIAGSYAASFPGGTSIFFNPVATYIGTSASVGNDVLTLDMFQNYSSPGAANWDGPYTEHIPLTLSTNAGAGSTVSGQIEYDGQSVGLVGPFGPGVYDVTPPAANLTGLNGSLLQADVDLVYDFTAGTLNGASASSSIVPEPAQALPLGLILLVFAHYVIARRRTRIQ